MLIINFTMLRTCKSRCCFSVFNGVDLETSLLSCSRCLMYGKSLHVRAAILN